MRTLAGLPLISSLSIAAPPVTLEAGGATIEVFLDADRFRLPPSALLGWVREAARAVIAYYGKFPVARARVYVAAEYGRGVPGATSNGDDGVWTRIGVGRDATAADLDDDWTLTHEMVHYGFPSVNRRHHWIEEGMATYVEPVARVQVGNLSSARIWGDMMRDMHQGLPEDGDAGLDNTHTWGRTYWGGALFCLMADIQIRRRTANAKGLQDALRAINRAGGNIEEDWPLQRALEIGDRATGGQILHDLYRQMAEKPVVIDLPGLWKRLGVGMRDGRVVFDPRAPLAGVREAIMRPNQVR